MGDTADMRFYAGMILILGTVLCISSMFSKFFFESIVPPSGSKTGKEKAGLDGYEIASIVYGTVVLATIIAASALGFQGSSSGMSTAGVAAAILLIAPCLVASFRGILDTYSRD